MAIHMERKIEGSPPPIPETFAVKRDERGPSPCEKPKVLMLWTGSDPSGGFTERILREDVHRLSRVARVTAAIIRTGEDFSKVLSEHHDYTVLCIGAHGCSEGFEFSSSFVVSDETPFVGKLSATCGQVVLLSCETGRDKGAIAARLARGLGLEFLAPVGMNHPHECQVNPLFGTVKNAFPYIIKRSSRFFPDGSMTRWDGYFDTRVRDLHCLYEKATCREVAYRMNRLLRLGKYYCAFCLSFRLVEKFSLKHRADRVYVQNKLFRLAIALIARKELGKTCALFTHCKNNGKDVIAILMLCRLRLMGPKYRSFLELMH